MKNKLKKEIEKYPICKYCGEPVVSPFKMNKHLSCEAAYLNEKIIDLDTKDIKIIRE